MSDAGFAMSYATQAGKCRLYDEMVKATENVVWHQPWPWNPGSVPMGRWAYGVDYADKDNPSFGAKMACVHWGDERHAEEAYMAKDAKKAFDRQEMVEKAKRLLDSYLDGEYGGISKKIKRAATDGSLLMEESWFEDSLGLYRLVASILKERGYRVDGMKVSWN